jgi:type IV secretory pathway VirB2 component (pilin)
LITFRSHLTATLNSMGVPHAATVADRISQSQQGSGPVSSIPHYVSVDFAHATQVVLYVMCGIMAAAGVIALFGLQRGRQETVPPDAEPVPEAASS